MTMNLKKKTYRKVYSTTQSSPNKIIKIFLIEDFFHLPPVSTTPVVHLELQISPRIFVKNWNSPEGIFRGLGETDSWKSQKSKISWHCHFKPFLFIREVYCARSVQTSFPNICLKLTIPGFPYTLFPVSCGSSHTRLSKFNLKKGRQMAITICIRLLYTSGRSAHPCDVFFQGWETLWGHNTPSISNEYERVKRVTCRM